MFWFTLLLFFLQIADIARLQAATCSGRTLQDDILTDSARRSHHSRRSSRAAVASGKRLWPNGTVPYFLDRALSNATRKVWHQGVEYWQSKTCLKFMEQSDEVDYIHVHAGSGCCSHVGKTGGAQKLILGTGCGSFGIVLHEIGHAIGFWHEQSRPDRDDFVHVFIENVFPKSRHNFKKYTTATVNSMDQPFDFRSIMMYGPKAYGMNRAQTLKPKVRGMLRHMGRSFLLNRNRKLSGLSEQDILQTNLVYQCPGLINDNIALLMQQEGNISSSNYPESYPTAHDFTWIIVTDPGPHSTLSLIFQDFAVGAVKYEDTLCSGDYLELRQGMGSLAPYLVKLCGHQVPDVITLLSGSLFLHLHSTDKRSPFWKKRFNLRYKTNNCSERLTDHEGFIQSPNYPGDFGPDINCVWIISMPEGYRINLTFTDFVFHDVDSRRGCTDYLELREGDKPLSKFVGRYCGGDNPGTIWAQNTLRVSMHSQASLRPVKGRFRAHYVAVDIDECAQDQSLCEHGCHNLPGGFTCGCYAGYQFVRANSRTVHCVDIDECEVVKGGCSYSCTNTDGSYFCKCPAGFYLGADMKTCLDSDECKFSVCSQKCINTPGSFRCSCCAGFILDIDLRSCILAVPMCTGTLRSPVGKLSSPTIPSWYRGSLDCHWTIMVREEYTIGLYVSLSWPRDEMCQTFLELNVDEGLGTQSLQLCGKQDVEGLGLVHFKSHKLRVRFFTEAPYPGRFSISYHMRPRKKELCGGDLRSANGVLQSPHHPSVYPSRASCVWKIHGAKGKRVQLQFEAFELEAESRCTYDRLDILERVNSSTKLRPMGRFCGNKAPPLISTAAREVWVKFYSDYTVQKTGFKANYLIIGN